MSDTDPGEFRDFEPDTDDSEALEAYAAELAAAVEAFGVVVVAPGGIDEGTPR